jgi:tetratricopeptide (TPR) repeat protein
LRKFSKPARLAKLKAPRALMASPRLALHREVAPTDGAVSEASFDATASDAYRAAFTALAAHPDAQVRLAVAQMSQEGTRDAAMQTLWTYANEHPDDPLRDEIYLLCGSVGEANNNPLGQRALEQATSLRTRDPAVWRMLSRSYSRVNRSAEAEAAAQVSEGVEAQNAGNTAEAEATLQQALPQLTAPQLRAPVASELGQIAEERGDFTAASARFSQAYTAREQVAEAAPNSAAAAELQADAQQLVRALDRSGRTREACDRLRQAQEQHDVSAPDQELLQRCQREFRTTLRDDVRLAPQLQRRSIEVTPRITPTPTP